MAAWPKEDVPLVDMRDWTTGSEDTSAYTVEWQPIDQAYDTGAIACSQCSTETHLWRPDSDLDDGTHYHLYVDGTKKDLLIAREAKPNM